MLRFDLSAMTESGTVVTRFRRAVASPNKCLQRMVDDRLIAASH